MEETIKKLIKEGKGATLNRAKIMTAGQGRNGKSATIRSLLAGQDFNPNLESTIGADTTKNDCQVNQTEINGKWKLLNDDEKKDIAAKHQARTLKEESRNPTKNKIKMKMMKKFQKIKQTNKKQELLLWMKKRKMK